MGFPLNLDNSPQTDKTGSLTETGTAHQSDLAKTNLSQEYSGTKSSGLADRQTTAGPNASAADRGPTVIADAGAGSKQEDKPDPLNDPSKTWEQKYEAVEDFIRKTYYPEARMAASNFYNLDKKYRGHIQTEADYVEAIKAETKALDDPWTEFKTTAEIHDHNQAVHDGNGFCGIWLKPQGKDNVVEALLYGFQAYKSDLKIGDKITWVNGHSVAGMTPEQIEPLLEGKQGDSVTVGFETPAGEKREQKLTFATKPDYKSSAEIVRDPKSGKDILHLGLLEFDREADDDLESAIKAIPKEKLRQVSGIVLDMRGNEGGLLPPIARTADMFVPPGDLYRIDSRDGIDFQKTEGFAEKDYDLDAETRGLLRTLPLAIMINGTTRSAPETLTAALRERGRPCAIVGEKSFGKDIVFDTNEVAGGMLKMTFEELKTPSGYAWQGKGLQPDVVVSNQRGANAPDDQLAKAVETVASCHKAP